MRSEGSRKAHEILGSTKYGINQQMKAFMEERDYTQREEETMQYESNYDVTGDANIRTGM
jgi:hypothetical protein